MSLVDIVIPTQFDRARHLPLVHQIKSALNQGVDTRVVILSSKENWNLYAGPVLEALSEREFEKVVPFWWPDGTKGDPFNTPDGYMCNPAIRAYMETEPIGDWQMHAADDDCLTPWALKYLLAAGDGQAMVMGRAVAVNRDYEDCREWKMGVELQRCHIDLSCGIIRTDALRSLPKPWFGITTGYEDWALIERMAQHFPSRLIHRL